MSFLVLLRYPWVPGTVFLGKETVDTFAKNSVLGFWGALSKTGTSTSEKNVFASTHSCCEEGTFRRGFGSGPG